MKEGNREHQTGNQELGTGAHCHGGDQVGGGWYHGGSPSALQALGAALAPLLALSTHLRWEIHPGLQ